jgi:ABC-type molybdate transport system substrate-binding protein
VTDGRSSKSAVDVVEIPEERNIRVNYPMVRISEPSSKNDAVISEFFEFVSGPTGDRVLAEAGFVLP